MYINSAKTTKNPERMTEIQVLDFYIIQVLNQISTKSKIFMKFEKHPKFSTGAILKFGEKTYEGLARNIKESRIEAAKKAMMDYKLRDIVIGSDKITTKNPISELNELAQRFNKEIFYEFSVIEIGNPSVFKCTISFGGVSTSATSIRKQDCKVECASKILKLLNEQSENLSKPEISPVINTVDSSSQYFITRDYQEEIYLKGVNTNIIACLATGCGKTFIAVLLIKKFSELTFEDFPKSKRIVFVVPTVALVFQQSDYIRRHTNLNVGFYCGETASPMESLNNWVKEISHNHVLVLTAELFRQLLQYNLIDISHLCLLIFDECHHGFNSGHPYNVIMTLYYARKRQDSAKVPRILGLTASPALNTSLSSFTLFEIRQKIEKLEQIFDSQCITSVEYLDSLKAVASNPDINLIVYQDDNENQIVSAVLSILQDYKSDFTRYFDQLNISKSFSGGFSSSHGLFIKPENKENYKIPVTAKNIKKCLIRCFDHSERIIRDLGIYAFDVMLRNMLKVVKELLIHDSYKPFLLIFVHFKKYLDNLYTFINDKVGKIVDRLVEISLQSLSNSSLVSTKLQSLLLLISKHYACSIDQVNSQLRSCSTLIFAAERSTCAIISTIINEFAKKEADYMNIPLKLVSDYVVGVTVTSFHKNLSDGIVNVSMKTNNIRLEKFSHGVINVMVATNVLEEGIDVRSCNVVIRFDGFVTLRSFIQSKGRIRQKDSMFYVFTNEKYKYEMEKRILVMKNAENGMEKILSKYCLDQTEYNPEFGYFEELEPHEHTLVTNKTQIDLRSAVAFIYQFCGRFSNSSTYQIKPRFYIQPEETRYRCYLRLPSECGVYTEVFSDALRDKKLAKQHCAMRAIKLLYKMGKIEENLFPIYSSSILDANSGRINEVPNISVIQPPANFYEKSIPTSLVLKNNSMKYFIYKIEFSDHGICKAKSEYYSSHDLSNNHIGLLIASEILSVSFPLASSTHSIQVGIKPHGCIEISFITKHFNLIQEFNRLLYEIFLKVVPKSCIWAPEKCHYSLWVVIFNKDGQLDINLMHQFIVFTKLSQLETHNLWPLSRGNSTYNGMIVVKNYSFDTTLYHVMGMNDVLSRDIIPGTSRSYHDYFSSKWSLNLDDNEIMLSCHAIKFDVNFLHNVTPLKKKMSDNIYLPASHTIPHPFSFNIIFQLMFVPSLLKRYMDFLTIEEWCRLNLDICGIDQIDSGSLDSFVHNISTNQIVKKQYISDDLKISFEDYYLSLSVYWKNSDLSSKRILFKSVFQAFTRVSSNECCNYERMELLGDCILKFIVTMILFVIHPNMGEGFLAMKRSKIVSNDNFTKLGSQLNIQKVINSKPINFGKNWCPPGFEVGKENFDVTFNDVILYQHISEKSIADVVESLVGCCLISSNISRVYDFFFKLNIMEDETISRKFITINHLLDEYKTLKFNYSNINSVSTDILHLETMIKYKFVDKCIAAQAITHMSAIVDTRQDSYERLEFLGDAVIGFIIVFYLYLCHDELKLKCFSPNIITHLESALVNNKILGVIAAKNSLLKSFQTKCFQLHSTLSHFVSCVENLEDLEDIEEVPYLGFIKKLSSTKDILSIPTIEVITIPKPAGDLLEAIIGAVFVDTHCDLVLTAKIFMPFFKPYIQKYLVKIPINPKKRLVENTMNYKKSSTKLENNMIKYTLEGEKDSQKYVGIARSYEDAYVAACYALMKFGPE